MQQGTHEGIIGTNVSGFQHRHCRLNLSNRRIRTCVTHADHSKVFGSLREDHQVDDEVHGGKLSKDCGIDFIFDKSIDLLRIRIKHAIINVETNGRAMTVDDLLFKKNSFCSGRNDRRDTNATES